MVYEYESKLLDYASGSKTYEEYKAMTQELEEVYRKAKTFDEIRVIEKTLDITGYQEDTESYMYEAEHIIEKYDMEDK